jgi:hypothetical protein
MKQVMEQLLEAPEQQSASALHLKVVTAETAHRGFFVNFCAQNSRNSGKRDLTLRFTHNIDREQGYRMHYSELFDHFSSLHGNASK